MLFPSLLSCRGSLVGRIGRVHRQKLPRRSFSGRLSLEALEDRCLPSYLVTDLGSLGGSFSEAFAINNSNQVVGGSYTAAGYLHAFLYSGRMIDLGTLGGSISNAFGINNRGQVVGWSSTASGSTHAFLYASGTMTDLGSLGGDFSIAQDISSNGQVVGESFTADGHLHAFLYSHGTMTDLGTLGGGLSEAFGINSNRQIVGVSSTSGGQLHAFLYSGTMIDLGTLGGSSSQANRINGNGVVAGWSYTTNDAQIHAITAGTGPMTDLGTIDGYFSEALGINNSGQVVGVLFTPGGSTEHAFLYSGGTMTDLNNLISAGSGYTLDSAHGITNDGVIVADAFDSAGRFHAVLMTPGSAPLSLASRSAIAAAPSPSTSVRPFPATDGVEQRYALGRGSIVLAMGAPTATSLTPSGGQPSLIGWAGLRQVGSHTAAERKARNALFAAPGDDRFWAWSSAAG